MQFSLLENIFWGQVTVNTAPSSVPQTDEASLESRNAISIDVRATNAGPGES